jgi:glycolate oxidase FAD binding subunit
VRAAARDHLTLIPWGGSPALMLAAELPAYDVALDLTALDAIVEFEPEDLTLTAECGATLGALEAAVRARGLEFPLERRALSATLGGALAANASGARRVRLGAPRDRILGARFVLGDGTLARSGGKVVKNVAGYGIHRLLCGSRGALAVVLEASVKLLPAPAMRRALLYPASASAAGAVAAFRNQPACSRCCLARSRGCAYAGEERGRRRRPGLPGTRRSGRRIRRARRVARCAHAHARGEDAAALWVTLASLGDARPARMSFASADNSPAAIASVVGHAGAGGLVYHALAGRLHVFPEPGYDVPLARALEEAGHTLIESHLVDGVARVLEPHSAVLALRRRIRAQLDPGSVLALGERWMRGAL